MEELINKRIVFEPSDSKTNYNIIFEINKEYKKLKFYFSYSPKELRDKKIADSLIKKGIKKYVPNKYHYLYSDYNKLYPLKNLLTISIDSPYNYVGCAHRQDSVQEHIISENFSSLGFIKEKIYFGKWKVTITNHQIVTNKCICNLVIKGYNKE